MRRYCLDTSAYIAFVGGDPRAASAIDAASWIGFPTVALGELYTGISLTRRGQREARQLADFLAHPIVEEIPVDNEVAVEYGLLVAELRRVGRPIPTNDVWIAACAARTSCTVLTCDSHFARIERVGCVILHPPPPTAPAPPAR